ARADALGIAPVLPPELGFLRDVALPAGLQADGRPVVSAHGDDHIIADNGRGIHQVAESRALPNHLASPRIVALHMARETHHQLVATVDLGDDRRAPGANPFAAALTQAAIAAFFIGPPDFLAGTLVESDQEGP